ncbi:hypothetical protein AKJ50_02370 [candidate division MSBL1 archaeon SCGC-AAA382A13]|uniref:Ferric oxidoreductase domain-containing protein n=1 Tax=candidate division MSBL1 archaeon SCGC-AAA382A13 TaxID=1698279 RepID=A0A133VDE7_9EURY|nr:hypothetical protein AKJ50_02370 [candidate division MSBL1 archaeon SCGC-AAA382A13]
MSQSHIEAKLFISGEPKHDFSATYQDNFYLKLSTGSPENGKQTFPGHETIPSETTWYIVRFMGILAYAFLSLTVMIALLRKLNLNRFDKLVGYHHDISYLAVIFSFLHVMNTIWENYMWRLDIGEIFWVNFSSRINTFISLGVISFYLMVVVESTSILERIKNYLNQKNWYFTHLLSYLVYIFVVIHSLFLGTDIAYLNFEGIFTILGSIIFWSFLTLNSILISLSIKSTIGEGR